MDLLHFLITELRGWFERLKNILSYFRESFLPYEFTEPTTKNRWLF